MLSLLALLAAFGSTADAPIACNLKALTPAEHTRHAEVGHSLKAAVINVEEVDGGYRLTLRSDFPTTELLQWIEAEQRCCPFLDFDVRLNRDNGRRSLQLTGREGVKEFLRQEIVAVREPGGVPAAPAKPTVASAVDFWVTRVEEQVVPAAEAMPEERYGFAPTNGAFTGVRTFAEQVRHLVKDSFAYLHRAAMALDPDTLLGPRANSSLQGNGRLGLLIDAIAHSSDHYGQMVEYLRLNGIGPPASR